MQSSELRVARALRVILPCLLLALAGFAAVGVRVFARPRLTSFFVLLMFLVAAAAYLMVRMERIRAAGMVTIGGSWLIITAFLALAGGMSTAAASLYVAGAAIVGLVHGTRSAVAWAALSSLAGLALVALERTGRAPPRLFPVPASAGWLDVTIGLLLVVVAVHLTFGSLREALAEARHQLGERRKAEEELLREKVFSDALVNSLPGIFAVCDESGNLVRWNGAAARLAGRPPEAPAAGSLADLIAPGERAAATAGMRKAFAGGDCSMELRIAAQDGRTTPYYFTGRRIELGDRRYLIGIGIDISERQRIEAELRQAQKMEAVGTMARGVAHDFNNILSAVYGFTELALRKAGVGSAAAEDLGKVLGAADKARDLVRQLLAFSRGEAPEKKPLALAPIVHEALLLLRASIPAAVEIREDVRSADLVLADPVQIHQVLLNLCTNAAQAMPETGGRIDVVLRDREVLPGGDPGGELPAGRYVCLDVGDTGPGMDAATLARIFEPYFTTKESGKGTGLGLSVVQGIVTSHKAHLKVDSSIGRGTVFHLAFPSLADCG